MVVRLQGSTKTVRLRRFIPFRVIGQGICKIHPPQIGTMVIVCGKGPFWVVDETPADLIAVARDGEPVKFKPYSEWKAVQDKPTELQLKAGTIFESLQPGDTVNLSGDKWTVVAKNKGGLHLRDSFERTCSVTKWAPMERVSRK